MPDRSLRQYTVERARIEKDRICKTLLEHPKILILSLASGKPTIAAAKKGWLS